MDRIFAHELRESVLFYSLCPQIARCAHTFIVMRMPPLNRALIKRAQSTVRRILHTCELFIGRGDVRARD